MTDTRSGDPVDSGDASVTMHRPSHEELLTPVVLAGSTETVDAIVVPTIRPAESLRAALTLAKEQDCSVLALCSGLSDFHEVIRLATEIDAVAAAADVTGLSIGVPLGAGAIAHEVSPGGKDVDLSLKRNIGLLVARMAGWRRLMFLDDDIRHVDPGHVRAAATRIANFRAIGFTFAGQYDNSVVCHAYRDAGGHQGTFVGGGAVVVPIDDETSYFPDVYNEDWLFFLNADGSLGPIGRLGSLTQGRYDPYDKPERARAQEFGDCLAEGLYALLHDGKTMSNVRRDYWVDRLRMRRELIDMVAGQEPVDMPAERRARRAAALAAARDTLDKIEPDHFIRFLKAWQRDREEWRTFVSELPESDPLAALGHLGITEIDATTGYRQRSK
jgi:hypothetical protein